MNLAEVRSKVLRQLDMIDDKGEEKIPRDYRVKVKLVKTGVRIKSDISERKGIHTLSFEFNIRKIRTDKSMDEAVVVATYGC